MALKSIFNVWVAYYINSLGFVSFIGLWQFELDAKRYICEQSPNVVFTRSSDNTFSFCYRGYSAILVNFNVY